MGLQYRKNGHPFFSIFYFNMKSESLSIEFPADGAYMPIVREFLANAAHLAGAGDCVANRVELVYDELLGSVLSKGARAGSSVRTSCEFGPNVLHIAIQGQGEDPIEASIALQEDA
jgi:anti-sigma regulatory factor (Ser/Thr protein kinase)